MGRTIQKYRGRLLRIHDSDFGTVLCWLVHQNGQAPPTDWRHAVMNGIKEGVDGYAPGCLLFDFDGLLTTSELAARFCGLLDQVLEAARQYGDEIPADDMNAMNRIRGWTSLGPYKVSFVEDAVRQLKELLAPVEGTPQY